MKFQREMGYDIYEEMKPLLELHFKEISANQDIALDPDWDGYTATEKAGCLRTFTARNDDGKLIAYAVFFVRHNLHYKNSFQAVQDVLYVDPATRGFGAKFIIWCDRQLKDEGVQVVYHHVKKAHNFGPLLERMNYKLVDLIFAKRLDKWA